jgi:hypothetical protein
MLALFLSFLVEEKKRLSARLFLWQMRQGRKLAIIRHAASLVAICTSTSPVLLCCSSVKVFAFSKFFVALCFLSYLLLNVPRELFGSLP